MPCCGTQTRLFARAQQFIYYSNFHLSIWCNVWSCDVIADRQRQLPFLFAIGHCLLPVACCQLPPVAYRTRPTGNAQWVGLNGKACVRHGVKEDVDNASIEVAGSLVLWEPTQVKRNQGGQQLTYVDQLKRDTGLKDVSEIRSWMLERDTWRSQSEARVRLRRPV